LEELHDDEEDTPKTSEFKRKMVPLARGGRTPASLVK
jgi:hypothetical protein